MSLLSLNIFPPCSSVFIVNFEQANDGWAGAINGTETEDLIKCESSFSKNFHDNGLSHENESHLLFE